MKELELSDYVKKELGKMIGKFAKELRREFNIAELDVLTVTVRLSNEGDGDSSELYALRKHQTKESIIV